MISKRKYIYSAVLYLLKIIHVKPILFKDQLPIQLCLYT